MTPDPFPGQMWYKITNSPTWLHTENFSRCLLKTAIIQRVSYRISSNRSPRLLLQQ